MRNILTVLGFGWTYLRRYWVRLTLGVLCGYVFAMSNASFIWASKTLTERFSEKTRVANTEVSEKVPALAGERFKVWRERIEAINTAIKRGVDPWLPRVNQPLDWRQMVGAMLFLPLLVGIRSVADYASNYCMGWVGERVIRDLRLDIMEKLSTLSLDFFTRSTTGDLLTRINVDSQNLLRALKQGAADLVKESGSVVFVLAALLLLDWRLTLWAMVLLPVCMFPLIVLGKKARRAMKAASRRTFRNPASSSSY